MEVAIVVLALVATTIALVILHRERSRKADAMEERTRTSREQAIQRLATPH